MNNMEINNLKDLAFYCIRNLNPCEVGQSLNYRTNNVSLTICPISSENNTLQIYFNYDYDSNTKWYKHYITEYFDVTNDEIAEFNFTRVCAKNDLFDAGLKIFKQDVSD